MRRWSRRPPVPTRWPKATGGTTPPRSAAAATSSSSASAARAARRPTSTASTRAPRSRRGASRRAVTEPQEREILLRCRADFDKRKIDLSMYTTPALADDVADLASAMQLAKINLYGMSYGTRWALEIMRRHPDLVRSAVLDGVYPPQVNGEQNEPEIVRTVPSSSSMPNAPPTALPRAQSRPARQRRRQARRRPSARRSSSPCSSRTARSRFSSMARSSCMVLLHMMRQGEAALIPEAVAAVQRGDVRLLKMFAEDLEEQRRRPARDRTPSSSTGSTTASNAARPGRRSTGRRGARSIEASGVYGLNARTQQVCRPSVRCGACRSRPLPSASRSRRPSRPC